MRGAASRRPHPSEFALRLSTVKPDRSALYVTLALGVVAGLGFAGFALHGNAIALAFIESTLAWCF